MRRFVLNRVEDETGISGTGYVADGVQFRNLKCVLFWRTAESSIAIYDDIETLMRIHGHNDKTVLEWIDHEYANSGGFCPNCKLPYSEHNIACPEPDRPEVVSWGYDEDGASLLWDIKND